MYHIRFIDDLESRITYEESITKRDISRVPEEEKYTSALSKLARTNKRTVCPVA